LAEEAKGQNEGNEDEASNVTGVVRLVGTTELDSGFLGLSSDLAVANDQEQP